MLLRKDLMHDPNHYIQPDDRYIHRPNQVKNSGLLAPPFGIKEEDPNGS